MKKILYILFSLFSVASFGQGAFQSNGRFAPTGNYFITVFGEAQTGFYPVARFTQRDSIPQWQLSQGMIVYAADRDSCYQLTSVLLRTWYSFKLGSAGDLTNYYTKTQADSRYLQSYTETDPIYTASSWYGTTNNSGNWNTAYSKRLSSAGLTSSTLTLTLADASTITASVPTFNQNTTGSAATLGTSRYIYGNLFNGSADVTSTISDTYIASADNWNTAYNQRISSYTSPLIISGNNLSIGQATTSTDGIVTHTDWNTFNGKQNALGFTPENTANKGAANGYTPLGADSRIPTAYMPAMALNNVWTVSGQSAMLALSSAVVGDVAIRSDSSLSYVLKSADYTKPYNWVQLLFPTAPVQSVNGQTGSVNLTTSNISEGSNMYYTDARARAALSFSAGSGGYNSSTGVITIPTNNNQISNGANYLTANQNITLSGDITGSGTTAITGTLATVNSNTGSWGGASSVPTFTVNGKGLITAAGNTSIQIAESQVTNLVSDLAGKQAAITNGTGFLKNNGSGTWSYDNSNYLTTSSAGSTYLPLSGGTLTGSLAGTSASFSTTANNFSLESTGTSSGEISRVKLYQNSSSSDSRSGVIEWYKGGSFSGDLRLLASGGIDVHNPSDQSIFNINASGVANFKTSLAAPDIVAGNSFIGNLNNTLTLGTDLSGTSFNNSANITANVTSTLQSVTGRGASTSNALTISNTTNATNYTTGALIISGGIGVAKDIITNGNIYANAVYLTKSGNLSRKNAMLFYDTITGKITYADTISAGFTPNSDTTVTANYTCTARDAGRNIFVNSSSSVTISMPQDSDASIAYTLPQNQKTITIWQQGTGAVVIAAGTGATVNVMDGASTIIGRYGAATLVKQAANTWYGAGALK